MIALIGAVAALHIVDAANYEESTALTALHYAYGSYCDAALLQSWNCRWCKELPHFTINAVFTSHSTELQGFAGYDSKSRQVVISFRGTKKLKNILLDLDWNQIYFKEGETYNTNAGEWAIHEGFYKGLHELYDQGLYASLRELFTEHKGANVLITGHSMGGALAQMLALMFVTIPRFESFSIGHVDIITFGSARWGSKDIVAYFNSLPHSNWRVVNKYDIIPTMPSQGAGRWGYYQSKSEVEYPDFGTLTHQMCDGDGEISSNCSYTALWNLKYHNYYLTVYEDGCGTRPATCRFGTRSLLETYINCTDDEWFTLPNATDSSKSSGSSDWIVLSLMSLIGVFVLFCFFTMKFCRQKNAKKKKDAAEHYHPMTEDIMEEDI